ncbi:MAG: hypothetical protein OXF72_00125 [Gammaproteobacteria bacterium]|nr:hypothetical protein [Gammaproteobacteria bacterium]MCY4277279.1 hypothetical protein [Gammaproteobacteria bacterium]
MNPVAYMERTRRYYAAQGFDEPYQWAHFDEVPFAMPRKPLAQSRLALITTASLAPRVETDRRSLVSGFVDDPPTRLYAEDLFWDRKATHLDDLNSYFPIDHLKALADSGRIGALARRFHCLPTEYSQRRTLTVDAPELLRRCREDGADLAMLVPL